VSSPLVSRSSGHTLAVRAGILLTALSLVGATRAAGQVFRFAVDPKASLAWWEVQPNLGHLWATTCPQDPAWQPGEGGASINAMVDRIRRGTPNLTKMSDTSRIPTYPRRVVRSLCTPAVTGELVAADTVTWRGTQGSLTILAERLVTGLDYRDEYARKTIYGADKYPEIHFYIDSITDVHRAPRDTMHAVVHGGFEFRGIRTPMAFPVLARHDGGGLRVQGKVHVPASYLVDLYGISKLALGLSVGTHIWKDLYMGVDVVLRPASGET